MFPFRLFYRTRIDVLNVSSFTSVDLCRYLLLVCEYEMWNRQYCRRMYHHRVYIWKFWN